MCLCVCEGVCACEMCVVCVCVMVCEVLLHCTAAATFAGTLQYLPVNGTTPSEPVLRDLLSCTVKRSPHHKTENVLCVQTSM